MEQNKDQSGAAVRGEAVAICPECGDVALCPRCDAAPVMIALTDAQIGNFWMARDCIEAIRAGDVVAQFVSAFRAGMKSLGVWARAADALDSQPTDDKRDDLIARLRHQVDELNGRLFDLQTAGQSTIRPTTKQLIAQLHDDQKWTIAEQNAVAEFLTRFPNESSQGMISLGDAWKHGQAYERALASSQPTDGGVRNG